MGLMNLSLEEDFLLIFFKRVKLSPNACFVDIGVNVGQTLIKFRSCRNNPYYGFEPNPACVYYIKALIDTNKIPDATLVPVGLSSSNAVAKFYMKSNVDTAGTIVNELRPGFYSQEDVQHVPVFSFDSLDVINKPIELIKIDVEGAELDVLTGMGDAIKKHKPAILCEILDSHSEENIPGMQAKADKLVAFITSLDYKILRIVHENGKITPEEISEVKLKKWTLQSWNLNDYLLLPKHVAYTDIMQA